MNNGVQKTFAIKKVKVVNLRNNRCNHQIHCKRVGPKLT